MGPHPYPAPPSRRPKLGKRYTPSCRAWRSLRCTDSTWCGSPRLPLTAPEGPGPLAPSTGAHSGALGRVAHAPPTAMPMDGKLPLTPEGSNHGLPSWPGTAQHRSRHTTGALGSGRDGAGHTAWQYAPPTLHVPDSIARMSDSDGSPPRDDRLHRRSHSRSPVSPGCEGETPA